MDAALQEGANIQDCTSAKAYPRRALFYLLSGQHTTLRVGVKRLVSSNFQLGSPTWRFWSAHNHSGHACAPTSTGPQPRLMCKNTRKFHLGNPTIMYSLMSGSSVDKEGARSSSSSEHDRNSSLAKLKDAAQDYRSSITGRGRSMSPMPLHRDKTDDPSIDGISDASTPVNSVSRTNSIASSVKTLVPYEPMISSSSANLSSLQRKEKELQSPITNLVDPVKSVGHRIETWPRVSGNPTRALNYQAAIRLVRSSLDYPTRGLISMEEEKDHPAGGHHCGDSRHGFLGSTKTHPPLVIRQQTIPTQNETTRASNEIVPRLLTARRRSSGLPSLFSLNKANILSQTDSSDDAPPRNTPAVLQRRKAIGSIRSTDTFDEQVAAAYEYTKHGQKYSRGSDNEDSLVSSHTGHDDDLGSQWHNAENTADTSEGVSTRDSNPIRETLCDTPPNFNPSAFIKIIAYHGSQTTVDSEDSSYRPRLGNTSPRNPRHTFSTGQKTRHTKCSGIDVNIDTSPAPMSARQCDAPSSFPRITEEAIATAKESDRSIQDDFVKRDRPGAKRSSCHELYVSSCPSNHCLEPMLILTLFQGSFTARKI